MGRTVETSDGCRIAYSVSGSGPAVLFVQGVGVHGDGWRPQTDALADRFTCVSFDHRGMGGSGPPAGPVSVDGMAADALTVLDAAGVESAHVVGHSLGGPVALAVALAARRRVRSLCLMCTFADGRAVAPLTARMMWLGLRATIGTRRMRRRGFLGLLYAPAAFPADPDAAAAELAPLFGHDLGDQPAAAKGQLRAMRQSNLLPRLGELTGLPTLVLSAAHDPIAPPRLGRALAAGIPGARFVEVADASHGLPITHADRVNELLRDHLRAAGAVC